MSPVRTRGGNRVVFPITFEKGLHEHQEESVLNTGQLSMLDNWIPEPTGALRVRRRWQSASTAGAPATRRTRGIGRISTQESFATPASRNEAMAEGTNVTSKGIGWPGATSQGSLLLAAVAAKKWIRRVQGAFADLGSNYGTTCTSSWPQATATGNTLVAVVTAFSESPNPTPTITPPAGWVSRATTTHANSRIEIFVIENASSRSGGEQFIFSTPSRRAVAIYEYEGCATASFDKAATATGTGSQISTGTTAALAQNDEVAIGGARHSFSIWQGPSNGFAAINGTGRTRIYEKFVERNDGLGTTEDNSQGGDWVGAVITLKASLTGPPTISAPAGWTQVTTVTRNQQRLSLFKIEGAAPRSGTETFTFSVNSRVEIGMMEHTGIALSGAQDQIATSSGSSTTIGSGTTGTTTQAAEHVLAFLWASDVPQGAPTNGFGTMMYVADRFTLYHKNVFITGTQTTAATIPSTRDWLGIVATFKSLQASTTGEHVLVANDDGTNFDIHRTNTVAAGTWADLDLNVPATSLDRNSPVVFATGLTRILWTHKDFTNTRSWDGNTANAAATVAAAPRGRAMCFYRNRFFIGGTKAGAFGNNGTTSEVSRLWFSDLGSYTVWNNNNFIDVGRDDGEAIEDIAPVGDGLLIAKRNSLWLLSGTGPDSFHLTELEEGGGHPGRSIAVGPFGAMVAGSNHVWLWSGGRPDLISDPIMDTYSIGGSFVSVRHLGDIVYICDSGSGTIWAYNHMHKTWWVESLPPGNDQPAIIGGFEKQFLYGPLASTTVSLLAYRNEPGTDHGRDVGLPTTYMAETGELFPGGAGRSITPRHLYIQVRQRGGDEMDAPLMVTPTYDGEEQATLEIMPRMMNGGMHGMTFRERLDIGSVAGIYGVKLRFEQENTTADEAVMDIERVEFIGIPSPHR